jgi:DNA polymerase III epsilon subunit-like protein
MFVCLDIETTGLSPSTDHIIEVAVVQFDHEKIIDKWSTLVKPSVPIPEFVSGLTNITDEMVKDAPKLEEVKDQIIEKVGAAPIMGHFIFFDINFLETKGIAFPNQQLDTCQLTQVLLHNEASYSLEVLTEKLGIAQPDAHRALADCEANIELFWQLSSHCRALPKEEKESIRPILEKSDWPWAELILPFLDEEKGALIEQSKTEKVIASGKHADLTNLTENLPTPFLFEEASHTYQDLIDYAENLKENSLLVIPNLDLLPQHKDLGTIKDPSNYIDKARLQKYLSQPSLNSLQTMLGAKATLWLHHSETGEKSEIKLLKDENHEWQNICSETPKQPSKKITAIDQKYFLTDHSRKEPHLTPPPNIVIGQTEQLVKEMEFAWRITFSEDRFESDKITILFGLLGMIFQKYCEENAFYKSLNIESFHRSTPEWNKVISAAESIETDDPYLTYLKKVLASPNSVLWMTLSQDNQPLLHTFPEKPSELFQQRVWQNIEHLHLFCHHANLADDYKFIKTELGLPEEITTHSTQDLIPLPLVETQTEITSPNNPHNIKEVANELGLHLPNAEGNIFLLVTSKKSAEQFFYALNTIAKDADKNLFVQNLNGGMGKIYKMASRTDGNNLFVGNETLLNFLLSEGVQLQFLAIHRLPFSPPNSPTQKTRAKAYTDAYKEFSLPQAALRFRGVINQFLGNNWESKKILILDPRSRENENILF